MKLADYEFSNALRRDVAFLDFVNDVRNLLNLGRYQMRVVSTVPTHTGEAGEHLLYISSTVRRLYLWDSVNSTWHFIEWNNSGLGQATIVGSVSLTAQTADIGATTIYTPAASGLYRVSVYALCTTAGAGGVLDIVFGWTDDYQAQTTTSIDDLSLTVAGSAASNTVTIRSTAAAITYAATITGKSGSPQYGLWLALERLT